MPHSSILFCFYLLCTLCSPFPAAARQDAFFCTREGTTLNYERRSPDGGKLWWIHSERINSVKHLKNGSKEADVTLSITGVEEKSILKKPVSTKALIYPDGTVELDVAAAAEIAARQKFSAFNFISSGGTSRLPSSLKAGDKLEDVDATVSWSGIKYTVKYYDRSVLRQETITVPAGTFDCIVVKEHKLEKAPLYKRERITYTWYAHGAGMIRHDTFFISGSQESSEKLVSID